ncbi:putative replication protein Rep [Mycobacterium avium MAV_120709_2344]|nr:putative replication protein Rep [Mycobacterium avium MAV_120709_2344]
MLTLWSPHGHRPVRCSPVQPRRGTAYVHRRKRRTRAGPRSGGLLARHSDPNGQLALLNSALPTVAAHTHECLALAEGGDAYCGVPIWSAAQRWARITVPIAYATHYPRLRTEMPYDAVSLTTLVKVADARAMFADGRTGRHCRPTNDTLAELAGVDARTVRRATRLLCAMGCATEILRGRQRTKRERLASWRLGSRQRGWASVWALHEPRPAVDKSRDAKGLWQPVFRELSTHPRRGSLSVAHGSFSSVLPTGAAVDNPAKAGHSPPTQGGATRPRPRQQQRARRRFVGVDEAGRLLAVRWLADGRTPSWAATHTPRGWARLLAAPAAHGWTPDDLNLAIHEWKTVNRRYLPVTPYRPIGLLGAILRTHDLAAPPAAMDRARQAAHRAQQLAEAAADRAEAAAKTACAATADQRAAARALFAENRKRFRR